MWNCLFACLVTVFVKKGKGFCEKSSENRIFTEPKTRIFPVSGEIEQNVFYSAKCVRV